MNKLIKDQVYLFSAIFLFLSANLVGAKIGVIGSRYVKVQVKHTDSSNKPYIRLALIAKGFYLTLITADGPGIPQWTTVLGVSFKPNMVFPKSGFKSFRIGDDFSLGTIYPCSCRIGIDFTKKEIRVVLKPKTKGGSHLDELNGVYDFTKWPDL